MSMNEDAGRFEFDDGYHYSLRERSEADQRAATEPAFDYYDVYRPSQPKFEIGQYVADQGFRVPLITDQTEWEKAFDNGNAMLRSEMPQDYDGLSGLLPSERIANDMIPSGGFHRELGKLVMRGLRSGELDPTEYMTSLTSWLHNWSIKQAALMQSAMDFGVQDFYLDLYHASASRWRYVEGTNISVFADPNVEGRYHFRVVQGSIGDYQVEPDEYDTPKQFRKHDVSFVARPFIEYYEEIRNLSRFDNTQNPVLELQQDNDGNIYFLQYLKTGQKQHFTEPFDLPSSDATLRTYNTRGVTPPAGKEMLLFITPNRLTKGMEGQAIYCSGIRPRGIEVQFASQAAAFILHEAYVSFQDNHFDSSPLYRPALAAGLDDCYDSPKPVLEKVTEVMRRTRNRTFPSSVEAVPYLDIKVTSNGREAAIESDWELKTIAYDDVR